MNCSAFRIFVFVCVVALCLSIGCREEKKEGNINIFERKSTNTDRRREVQRSDDDQLRRVTEALQRTTDPEKRKESITLMPYVILLSAAAVIVAGLVYWKVLRQKWAAWELNDPMALVQELNYVHQLSEQEKRFMQDLSGKNMLSSPLKLFVEPKFLLEAWEDDSLDSNVRPSVRCLLSKLFEITPEGSEEA